MVVLGVGIPSATTSLLFDLDYMVVDKLMVAYSDAALAAIGDGITVLLSLAAYLRWRPRARTETPQ